MNQNIYTNEMIKQLVNKVDIMVTHNKMLEIHIFLVAQHQVPIAASAEYFRPTAAEPKKTY